MRTENITTPALHVLDGIRKLKGEPKITYPTPSRRLKKIERVVAVARSKADLPYGTRDPKYKTARLAYQAITGGDAQNVEVYRVYLTKATPDQQNEWGYQVSYPTADPDYPRITWTFRIEDKDYAALPDGSTCLIDGYETLEIIEQQFQPSTDGAFFGTETRVYERIPGSPMVTLTTDPEGLDLTVLSQVVEPDTTPTTGHLVQADTITSINTRQAQRDQRLIDSFPPQPGQLYDETLNTPIEFTDQTVARASNITAGVTEATPIDYARRRDRTYEVPHAALNAFVRRMATFINLELPAELLLLQAVWESSQGNGEYEENGTGAAQGAAVSLALSPRGSANSSASVSPELYYEIRERSASPVKAEDVVFYTTDASDVAVLARLTTIYGMTVSAWPAFQKQTYRFILKGQKVVVSAQTSVSNSVNLSQSSYSYAYTEGSGEDYDEATSLRSIDIGPVINEDLPITGDTSRARTAQAISVTTLTSGMNWPGGVASAVAAATANGGIYPTSLPATSPSSVPTSGLYVTDIRPEIYKWGYTIIRATVVDASNFVTVS